MSPSLHQEVRTAQNHKKLLLMKKALTYTCKTNLTLVYLAFPGHLPLLHNTHLSSVFSWRWHLRWWLRSPWRVTTFFWISPMYTFWVFSLVNLSFITGGSHPRTQNGRGKIIFPSLQRGCVEGRDFKGAWGNLGGIGSLYLDWDDISRVHRCVSLSDCTL